MLSVIFQKKQFKNSLELCLWCSNFWNNCPNSYKFTVWFEEQNFWTPHNYFWKCVYTSKIRNLQWKIIKNKNRISRRSKNKIPESFLRSMLLKAKHKHAEMFFSFIEAAHKEVQITICRNSRLKINSLVFILIIGD